MVRKRSFWMVLVSALILAGCIPVPIPIDLGNPEISERITLSSGERDWNFKDMELDGNEIAQKIREQGIPGTVTFHDMKFSGKVNVEEGTTLEGAFVGFSLEDPSGKSFEVLPRDWTIENLTGEQSFSVSAKSSPALREALRKINNKEKFTLYVVFGYERCNGNGTLTIEVNNVTVWITWTAW